MNAEGTAAPEQLPEQGTKGPDEPEKRHRWVIGILIALAAALFAGLEIVINVCPWIIGWNADYEGMANKGHAESQMHVAQTAYDSHDYVKAIDYYDKASEKKGKYQAAAFYNLGCIFAGGLNSDEEDLQKVLNLEKAYKCFRMAAELGLSEARANGVAVLLRGGKGSFPNIDQKEIAEFLFANHYSHVKAICAKVFEADKGRDIIIGDTKYIYFGTETRFKPCLTEQGDVIEIPKTCYIYVATVYMGDEDVPEHSFTPIDREQVQ